MASTKENEGEKAERKRDIVGEMLKKNLAKGEMALKHAVGLGATVNAVPLAPPVYDGPERVVEVGWHPVGGLAGKWFAEQTGLGKMITEKINDYPDPTQHWAVLVGGYAHQLWMDENFDVIYTNAAIVPDEWRRFQVGQTRFNDDAIRRTGEQVISKIRETQPGYNLISNNCQTYVLQLLDAIKAGAQKEFGTTLAVYDRLTGPGAVMDLFDQKQDENGQNGQQALPAPPGQEGVPPQGQPQYAPPLGQPQYAPPQGLPPPGQYPSQQQYTPPPSQPYFPPPPGQHGAPPPPGLQAIPPPDGQQHSYPPPAGQPPAQAQGFSHTVSFAQQLMHDNTTQLSTTGEQTRGGPGGGDGKEGKKKGMFSRLFSSKKDK